MVDLARAESEDRLMSLAEVARHSGISRRYLEQLAFLLKNAGLIQGFSGRHGGYALSRPAVSISVGDVVRAASGQLEIAECVGDPESCMNTEFCECRPIWVLLNHEIEKVLGAYTLDDLADRDRMKTLQQRAFALEQGT
jgi:Rrf2 family transcriptional regulator, iron-sulfur cluster assembly transcription factor